MTTTGDQILDSPLSKIGGKGLFVKELELAMEEGRADLAVHSMKDVPMNLPPGFALAAIGEREDPRDALVSNQYSTLADLPSGAVVGTSSLRRQALLMARYPHLVIEPLRGNVQTRLRKLDEGQYAAIVLAAAGLKRLGLAERDDLMRLLAPLNHADTAACVTAERAMSRRLAGSCQTPLGAYAEILGQSLHLTGFVADLEGKRFVQAARSGAPSDAEKIGNALAEELLAQGAGEILAELGVMP